MAIADLSSPVLVESKMQNLLERVFTKQGIVVTAATFTVLPVHDDILIELDRATGITVTLPAASGSGRKFRFLIKTSVSGGSTIIKVANSTDTMVGMIVGGILAGGTGQFIEGAGTTDDTITMNGGTTGGLAGSYFELTDIRAGLWLVNGHNIGSGTMVSYLTATV